MSQAEALGSRFFSMLLAIPVSWGEIISWRISKRKTGLDLVYLDGIPPVDLKRFVSGQVIEMSGKEFGNLVAVVVLCLWYQ
jgi:hypothetical protein